MVKHLVKVSNYIENEGIIYCPKKDRFETLTLDFPLKCPFCGKVFNTKNDIKFVFKHDYLWIN
jgi:hypothetical protein